MGSIPVGVTTSFAFSKRLLWSESRSTSLPVGVTTSVFNLLTNRWLMSFVFCGGRVREWILTRRVCVLKAFHTFSFV